MTDITTPATGGQGGAAPVAAPTAPAAATQPTTWTEGFAPDAVGYVQNKGWRNPADLLTSYQNLEKLRGVPQERLLALPEKDDDAEGWDRVFERLGRPAKPDEYGLNPGEGQDDSFSKAASDWFHKAGLTKKQAAALVEDWDKYIGSHQENSLRELEQNQAAELNDLKREWGSRFDENTELAKRAVRSVGLSDQIVQTIEAAIGTRETMQLFERIGRMTSEAPRHGFESGGTQGFGATPESAKARIKALQGDGEFVKKYLAGDINAKQEMERLHKIAFPA